ncbi:hypothetical protein CLV34_0592 [Luteimicrobium subarcticum]|uniref:Uncharacterized protein n=1 Tax=Luteimicrobium subarcticum TaxID=620910 RepID=A0A2M8WUY3_9MICO|nr:hypothetical protein CLV34_0592 [Luteimicrobium subarcticum]
MNATSIKFVTIKHMTIDRPTTHVSRHLAWPGGERGYSRPIGSSTWCQPV